MHVMLEFTEKNAWKHAFVKAFEDGDIKNKNLL